MSTNSECLLIEVAPGKWYFVLEDYHAPKNAWDWREHAVAYGPFPTLEAAETEFRFHANPGGSWTTPFEEGYKMDATMLRLTTEARKPSDPRYR